MGGAVTGLLVTQPHSHEGVWATRRLEDLIIIDALSHEGSEVLLLPTVLTPLLQLPYLRFRTLVHSLAHPLFLESFSFSHSHHQLADLVIE